MLAIISLPQGEISVIPESAKLSHVSNPSKMPNGGGDEYEIYLLSKGLNFVILSGDFLPYVGV